MIACSHGPLGSGRSRRREIGVTISEVNECISVKQLTANNCLAVGMWGILQGCNFFGPSAPALATHAGSRAAAFQAVVTFSFQPWLVVSGVMDGGTTLQNHGHKPSHHRLGHHAVCWSYQAGKSCAIGQSFPAAGEQGKNAATLCSLQLFTLHNISREVQCVTMASEPGLVSLLLNEHRFCLAPGRSHDRTRHTFDHFLQEQAAGMCVGMQSQF